MCSECNWMTTNLGSSGIPSNLRISKGSPTCSKCSRVMVATRDLK